MTSACTLWRRRLTQAESTLTRAPSDDLPHLDLAALRSHPEECAACARSHGPRLSALETRFALRSRSVPDGLLEGFYDRLEAEAHMAPLGGGMSLAFLDAPRSLCAWRMAAMTMGILLVVGVVWTMTHGVGEPASTGRPLRELPDARATLLPAWESRPQDEPERQLHVRPADGHFWNRPRTVPASVAAPSLRHD